MRRDRKYPRELRPDERARLSDRREALLLSARPERDPLFAAEVPAFIDEIRRLFTAREIRDDLDHLERTKYLASHQPDLEPESEEDLDEEEFDLESPVMGAQELLRFSCVRELLEA